MAERLELIDVRKSFNGKAVLDGVTLAVPVGKSVMIIGPNACGKTTLLKIMAGLLKPDSGQVSVNGVVSLVFQEDLMVPWMSLEGNIGLFLKLMGREKNDVAKMVGDVASMLGISEYVSLKPREVSGGTLRKAAIARALTLKPDILLLDEPLIELDSDSRQSVIGLLENLRRNEKMSMFITTHYPEELESMVDTVYYLTEKPTRVKQSKAITPHV
ncbi:MAG: ATP-binding cassette domain-containing protein [Thaumarchaeota archaeon]|nr:ATP-binding cassette domain-containing protein [Nitrososphaerota archaeon]